VARHAPGPHALALQHSSVDTAQVESVEGLDASEARPSASAAELVAGPPLVAHGSGWDASGAWRHAGTRPKCHSSCG
jgi:hypothetical protein